MENAFSKAAADLRVYEQEGNQGAGQMLANTYRNSINSLKKEARTLDQKKIVRGIERVCLLFPREGGKRMLKGKRKRNTKKKRNTGKR
jgi:hypothetical protein